MNKKLLEALTIIEEEHNRTKRDIEIIQQATQEIERLNNIINEMEQFFIDNANDEMKKCFDKLHSLKGSDKE